MQVADVIAEDLQRGHSPEPIELGHTAALGLLFHAFLDKNAGDVHAHVARSDDVAALYLALRRFRPGRCLVRRGLPNPQSGRAANTFTPRMVVVAKNSE